MVDTNSSWLAQALWELEVTVAWMSSCRDDRPDMERALRDATGRADLVVVSGGLGPTQDDLTVDVVAAMLGVAPVIHEPSRKLMEERFAAAKFRLTPNNLRQVEVPEGAFVLANPVGLAPGFEVSMSGTPVVCMPGVPRELKAIFTSAVKDRVVALRESRGERVQRIARRIYRTFGAGESHIATRLEGVGADSAGTSIHYQAKFPEVLVKLVIRDRDQSAAMERLESLDSEIRERLTPDLYGTDDDSLPAALGRALMNVGATMATAESCTGGMIGALITEVAGSSAYYLGGAVTYSNEEKKRQLGVSEATLVEHGAVSEACVVEMARGARDRVGVDYAVAVSGVAGPQGGTAEKPVGTVWVAVVGPRGSATKRLQWPGDRQRIRRLTAHWALRMILGALRDDSVDRAQDDPRAGQKASQTAERPGGAGAGAENE
ncbi:MAG: CinA family nicotinamide mononucleotide deamidase-related protein [Proteobacteria bacterium]|nr:CinA family nicotinamide mononucleotide deamidase-related protein [Pseudomonadota bacterium]